VAPTFIDPPFLVILSVVHHLQDVNDALGVIHPANQPKTIVAYVEDNAVPNLIGRSKGLLERRETAPVGVLSNLSPGDQESFSNLGIDLPAQPKLS
jgi:hypothetical protein